MLSILLRHLLLASISLPALVAAADVARSKPSQIGERKLVVEFSAPSGENPREVQLISSEAAALDRLAVWLVQNGKIRVGSPGVVSLGNERYRATLAFPIEGDESPLPQSLSPPKPRITPMPAYPFESRKARTVGAALLRLHIDEKAKLIKVELVRASHKEFGNAAIQAVNKWAFSQPAKDAGKAVPVVMNQLMVFGLDGLPLPSWEWLVAPEPAFENFEILGATMPLDAK